MTMDSDIFIREIILEIFTKDDGFYLQAGDRSTNVSRIAHRHSKGWLCRIEVQGDIVDIRSGTNQNSIFRFFGDVKTWGDLFDLKDENAFKDMISKLEQFKNFAKDKYK